MMFSLATIRSEDFKKYKYTQWCTYWEHVDTDNSFPKCLLVWVQIGIIS